MLAIFEWCYPLYDVKKATSETFFSPPGVCKNVWLSTRNRGSVHCKKRSFYKIILKLMPVSAVYKFILIFIQIFICLLIFSNFEIFLKNPTFSILRFVQIYIKWCQKYSKPKIFQTTHKPNFNPQFRSPFKTELLVLPKSSYPNLVILS